ncbi:alpha/beta fold hydrolase [Sciscionella sediminilitoris]|uniref:alpha/beta fold hydrolase n=1 Tax=Sciscionella sediminilitoris TaxID=1445613 RepID=UPI0004DEEE55|nr:alpha/beta hydrolase [Sciscionella sp. SE31]
MAFLDIDGIALHYTENGTGEPLLFLHGWGTSGRVWDAQLPEFVRDHRVLTLDWRGCGRSDQPAQGNDHEQVCADLLAVFDALGIRAAALIGSSIGAAFSTEFALRHPERVTQLVAVDGPAYWGAEGDLGELRQRLATARAATLAEWVPGWYAPGTAPALIGATERMILESGVFIDAHFDWLAGYDPRPALPGLAVPVSYVHGALDPQIPLAVAEHCAALTPGARLRVIEQAGHMPQLERPAEFNATLRALLED